MTDNAELGRLLEQGRQQLEVVRRQSFVYSLYSRKHKHAMVGGVVMGGERFYVLLMCRLWDATFMALYFPQ